AKLPPDEPLHRDDRVIRIRDRLPLRRVPDQAPPRRGEGDDGGGREVTPVRDHVGHAVHDDRDAGVGRPEVDPDRDLFVSGAHPNLSSYENGPLPPQFLEALGEADWPSSSAKPSRYGACVTRAPYRPQAGDGR